MLTFLNRLFFTLLLFVCGFMVNAQQKKFTLLPSAQTGVNFKNDINEDPAMFYYLYEYLYVGAGVSIGDINNDGLPDIYFSSTRGYNKLYLNLGNLQFKDITDAAGVNGGDGIKTGVNMVDVNGDGFLDIFICKSGYKDAALRKKILYINNGNSTFTNKAAQYGLDDASYTTQSYFFDYDNDGDKDVYFVNHPIDFSKSMAIPATMQNGKLIYVEDTNTVYVSSRLYENKGGKFIDVTKKAGVINHAFGLSASIFDFNNDGYPDIYVANDFHKPDFLYINNKNGTFTNKLSNYVNHISFSAMGTDVNDINNDGLEDLFTVDMAVEEPKRQKQLFALNQNYDKFNLMVSLNLFYQYPRNTLQLNNGDGTFSEIANHAGVAETEWSWAPLIADYDNDGWKDIYITNGLKRDITDWDYKVFVLDSIMNSMNKGKSVDFDKWLQSIPSVKTKNYLYHNNGSLHFDNFTNTWMDEPATFSSGAAYGDLDNDGDLDIVVNNVDDEAFIFKNNTSDNANTSNYLRFKFLKDPTTLNEVYGVTVNITNTAGQTQTQHYNPQRGFMSTMEHMLHFGTAAETVIPQVEIIFPSLKKIFLQNVKANQVLTVYESDAHSPGIKKAITKSIFVNTTNDKLKYTQTEDDYIDFKREPLIPYKCSRKGPYYTLADINGDGKQDMYIGGATGTEGKLFLQNVNGVFNEKKQAAFIVDKDYEDMGCVFFDADGDKDNDLYVVSGGASFAAGDKMYQDRLYINDGKGNFTKATKALPVEGFNGSCVTALDYDGDGDIDLFVGGHVLPGKFPQADNSMLLQNNKGVFTIVSNQTVTEITKPGIVNAAAWADTDGDGKKELIITGEWMATAIYTIDNNSFKKQQHTVSFISPNTQKDTTISLADCTGWWYSMQINDIDNDGDIDIVLGNRGTNAVIKGDFYNPCTIYAKDFDNNGSYDAVLGYYNQGKCYPLYSRDQLIDQMPSMRKKFIRYSDYSGKTLDEIFTTEQKQGMDIYTTRFFNSGVLLNEGNGNYRFIALPEKAQLSTINDMVIDDFDSDGKKDMIVCGNNNDAAVMVGNSDATAALLLKGDGNGSFTPIPNTSSGIQTRGESRKIVYLKESKTFILLKNSTAAQAFILNDTK